MNRLLSIVGSSLRFIKISRSFGLFVAIKVAYSKVRGVLLPALALPSAPRYGVRQRHLSILLDIAIHRLAVCEAMADLLSARGDGDWEMCLCASFPIAPDAAQMLRRLHGKTPWIRIIRAGDSSSNAKIVQWTVEQATGRAVLLLGRDHVPNNERLSSSVEALLKQVTCDTAIRIDEGADHIAARSSGTADDNCILLVKKSAYLVLPYLDFSLDPAVVVARLKTQGVSASRRST